MAIQYPNQIDSFTTKTDFVDDVWAADVNDLQDAIVAIQTTLGISPQGVFLDIKARLESIESTKQDALGFTPENIEMKGQPHGYAALDGEGKLDASHIPDIGMAMYGDEYHNVDYLKVSDKAVPNGVASLDAEGKLYSDQLPELEDLSIHGDELHSVTYIHASEKGEANGIAALDETGKLAEIHVPDTVVSHGDDAHTEDYLHVSDRGVANGVASLDSNTRLPLAQMSLHDHDNIYLNINNISFYTPSHDHNPATKKYVDDSVGAVDPIDFINESDRYISGERIDGIDASQIISGDIHRDRMAENVIAAINQSEDVATISGERITPETINTAHLVNGAVTTDKIADESVTNIKVIDLDAGKLTSGNVGTSRMEANVIAAINNNLHNFITGTRIGVNTLPGDRLVDGAVVGSKIADNTIGNVKIIDLDANKLFGELPASTLQTSVISAINSSEEFINGERIAVNSITEAHLQSNSVTTDKIANLSVTNDKIVSMSGSKLTSGDAPIDVMITNVIAAINSSTGFISGARLADNSVDTRHIIDDAVTDDKIQGVSGAKVTGSLPSSALQEYVIHAINNAPAGNFIAGARIADNSITNTKISDVSATKINTGDIATNRMRANVISAVNAHQGEDTISSTRLASIPADKIDSGDLATGRMRANVISAINTNPEDLIDANKITGLSASQFSGGILDLSDVVIASNSDRTGERIEIYNDIFDVLVNQNRILRITPQQGLDIHGATGLRLSGDGSIRINTDMIIDSDGIRAKAGGEDFTAFFTGDHLRFEDPEDNLRQLVIESGMLMLTTDGGESASSAITPEGIYGNLIIDGSLPGSSFDQDPPDTPTWDDPPLVSILEETAITTIVSLIARWNEVVDDDLQGYKVYIKEETESVFLPTVLGKTTEYKFSGVKPNTTYEVRVSAFDVQGNESPLSTIKIITTQEDTISPAQPTEPPEVVYGFKSFVIKWPNTELNEDSSPCIDLAYYEVERSHIDNPDNWVFMGNIKGTSFVDTGVDYDIYYRYRYRPVDTSGNRPLWSPNSDWHSPLRVDTPDLVAHSVTVDKLYAEGLLADIIYGNKIHGEYIEADTITANTFQSTLYGDITQSIRYVESILDQMLFDWQGSDETYAEGTHNDTYVYDDVLMLDTIYHWEDEGLEWDTTYHWDKPVVLSGSWESIVFDIGSLETQLIMPALLTEGSSEATVITYIRTSEDNEEWTEYEEFTAGTMGVFRYLQFKIELSIPNDEENVRVRLFRIRSYVNRPDEFVAPFITLNADNISGVPTEDGGVSIRRGNQPSARIVWDETLEVWKAGIEGYEEILAVGTGMEIHDNEWHTEDYQPISEKGEANGYASLDSEGKVPAEQLGDIVGMEVHGNNWHDPNFEPELGSGTNQQYLRGDKTWQTLLGETSTTAHRGDHGKAAHDHVTSDGSDHSFINQNVTTDATPEFSGIKLGNFEITFNSEENTLDFNLAT